MLDFIANLLTPIFTGMGASATDVQTYVTQCGPYIYGLLGAIVLLIVILVAAHWVKKGAKHVVRWTAVLAFLTAVVVLANCICYGPMKGTLETYLSGGSDLNLKEETIANSRDIVKQIGEEGIVLVKNEGNLLPLAADTKNLNIFGWASTDPIYGGTGSGGSSTEGNVSIMKSLTDAGFVTNASLTAIYEGYSKDGEKVVRGAIGMNGQDWTLPEPTVDVYTDDVMANAKSHSDVAVIVISRSGGEDADLPNDMNAVIKGTYTQYKDNGEMIHHYTDSTYRNTGDYDDFEVGEHYLELSVSEENMVAKVCENFDKVIVIVNANNAMELGWTNEYEQIKAVLLAPGGGVSGFAGIGEILNCSVNPSGHTADTYVKDLMKTPYAQNIGHFRYNNTQEIEAANADASRYQGIVSFVNYVEGIYVGYKFYETAYVESEAAKAAAVAATPAEGEAAVETTATWIESFNYDDYVMYPFGYGLSYTTFEQKIENFKADGDNVTFDVKVTNTGAVAGKSVVEVYFNPPYTNGGIEKAAVNLVEYGKTEALAPGASETISFSIAKEDFASYDSSCIKTANGGYVLEAGTYEVSIRENSHVVLDTATFTVDADIDYSVNGRPSDKTAATNEFESYSNGGVEYLSRANGFANYETATAAPAAERFVMSDEQKAIVARNLHAEFKEKAASMDNASDVMPTTGAKNNLVVADLRGAAYDDERWEKLLDEMSFDDMSTLICLGGWHTEAIESIGKVRTADCDGPAGLNNFMTGKQGTAFGTEVLMAQTWNQKLASVLGERLGAEYVDVENWGVYGPAMNTHRSPFAGRNFEYYSEDGVLAGKFAAAQVNGMGKTGVYPYIKHFALNDQEINRCAALNTFSTEQAIREIYLKPFELVVKAYQYPQLAVMSAFNWIGTEPCATNPHLLQNVLRNEWGFVGMVETDYDGGYGFQIADIGIRVGNDLYLGFTNNADSNEFTKSATSMQAMRTACHNILYTIGNSGAYANALKTGEKSELDKLFDTVNLSAGIGLGVLFLLVLVRFFMNKKKGKYAA